MRKILALVLVLLVALPMALALTKADLTTKPSAANFGRVSPLASSLLTLNLAKVRGIDQIRSGHTRIPVQPCVMQATNATFNTLVLESSKPVVVDFWAPWCSWCTVFKPTFDQACEEYKDRINFVGFNADLDESVWATYGLEGIPAQIMFNHGNEVARNSGAVSIERFRGWLNGVLRSL